MNGWTNEQMATAVKWMEDGQMNNAQIDRWSTGQMDE